MPGEKEHTNDLLMVKLKIVKCYMKNEAG